MRFVGLDIHKRQVEATVLDEAGKVVHRQRFDCTRAALQCFAAKWLGPESRVALEATTNTWSVFDVLAPLCGEVVVSNPLRTRAIAEAKIKNDKVDALVLAQLLRADFLPRVWAPDEPTRQNRRLCTRRVALVGDRTRIKNRIHAVLHQRLIRAPEGDLFSPKNLRWLVGIALDSDGRACVDSELRMLEGVERELELLGDTLAKHGFDDPRVRLLMTLPGVDVAIAQILVSTLGDISRFSNPDRAAAYVGLVPSTKQSGDPDHIYHGPITKQGKSHARWMLIQAAQHVAGHPGPLGAFFQRLAKKKNRNVAVVATARKLVTIAWHMLKNNEPYRYAIPRTTEAKLARLRVRATGERRKGGSFKGQPRSPNYGKGGTSLIPALDDVYLKEGLPALQPLPTGEEKMLTQRKLITFAATVRQAHRVPHRAQKARS